MRHDVCFLSAWMVLCAACSGSPSEATGGGGTGGSGTTGGAGGTSAGGTGGAGGTSSGGTSAGGTGGCSAPANVYDNAQETGLPACNHPVAPLPDEDGTFAVTVFGPFATAFELGGFSFAAAEGPDSMITDPWTAAVVVVPAGSDPLEVDPDGSAKPYPLTLIEDLPAASYTVHRYSMTLDAPLAVGPCDTVVVALRNTKGPPDSWLQMCGSGSEHPETNQWWNLDGTMTVMASYGTTYDRDWWVSLMPVPGN